LRGPRSGDVFKELTGTEPGMEKENDDDAEDSSDRDVWKDGKTT